MREWGFTDAVATTGGADGGIDVRSSRALAQVKWRGGLAGRPDLQKLYGARGADTSKALLFFAASGYSKAALDYAKDVGMSLYIYDPVGTVTAVNDHPLPVKRGQKVDIELIIYLAIGLICSLGLMIAILTS